MNRMNDEELVKADVVAHRLGLTVPTIRKLTYLKRIPSVRVGKRAVRYRLADVERILIQEQPARA